MASRRRWFRRFMYVVSVLLLLAVAAEITVRVQGRRSWSEPEAILRREDGGPLFVPDAVLGYRNARGSMTCILSPTIKYKVTHDAEGHRACLPEGSKVLSTLWIFGCSFAHGYGVNDEETFAWKLGEGLQGTTITNFGVDGYGPHQSLQQLKTELEKGNKPEEVLLCYGGFHNQRVVCSPYWQKAIAGEDALREWKYPYRRKSGAGFMQVAYTPSFPAIQYSAFLNLLDDKACDRAERELASAEVTESVIREMGKLCSDNGIRFYVAGIWKHPDTDAMLEKLKPFFPVRDVSADPSLTLFPGDLHPNAEGHRQIAEKLTAFIFDNKSDTSGPK